MFYIPLVSRTHILEGDKYLLHDDIYIPCLITRSYAQLDLIDPVFLQKKSVCLYHI